MTQVLGKPNFIVRKVKCGCVVALINADDEDWIIQTVEAAFAFEGLLTPHFFRALAASGAHRVA